MILTIEGHDRRYLCESLCLLFFPGSRFGGDRTGGSVSCVLEPRGKGYIARVTMDTPEGYGEGTAVSDDDRTAIGRAFLKAGRAVTGISPPWGTLTGIRPAKLARELLEQGNTAEQAARIFSKRHSARLQKARLCVAAAAVELETERMLPDRSMSLYIGIPFCPSRCSYCSFVSHSVSKAGAFIEPYVELLCRELAHAGAQARRLGLKLVTVYVGGGTPTVLTAQQLGRVLAAVADAFDLGGLREYTVEAGRPETIDDEKLEVMLRAGAGRVSVNPQTMDDEVLRAIGRRHTAEETRIAYDMARRAGFDSINMDLIAGLPGDTPDGFMNSLRSVMALGPENITVHTLSIKRAAGLAGTPELIRRGAAGVGEMVTGAGRALTKAGYGAYYLYRQKNTSGNHENVGYARPGHEGLYNILIMGELHTIFAVGAGGVTKLVSRDGKRIERVFNPKYPYEYIGGFEEMLLKKRYVDTFYTDFYECGGK